MKPKKSNKRPKKSTKKATPTDQDVEFVGTVEIGKDNVEETPLKEPEVPEQKEEEQKIDEPQPTADEPEPTADEPKNDEQPTEEQQNEEELDGEVQLSGDPDSITRSRKRKRGPTRMKDIAKDPNTKVQVAFNFMGEAYGSGSVMLSSYLGPLVREHVPVTLESWKKLSEEMKTVLWKSVQARFELGEEYQKVAVLKQLGCLWRSSKSRLVTSINEAENNQQRNLLRPKNVSPTEWRKFVKLKTSKEFKAVSDSYKERRRRQIPHTCSRKGMVRLAEEMKSSSEDPSEVTRIKVWVKSRTRKDGTPINTNAAEKIQMAAEIVQSKGSTSTGANNDDDALIQLLGPDNPGRMRAMGRNISKTKLACFQVKDSTMSQMQEKQADLQEKVLQLQAELAIVKNQRQDHDFFTGENSAVRSVNKKSQPRCLLIDWADDEGNVAEGRIISSDPDESVNGSRLGPTDVKVIVDAATVPEAFLWRPATNLFTMEEAVGHMIAWPKNKCVELGLGLLEDDIAPLGSKTNSLNKCKLLELGDSDGVVAEGRWQTQEPKALVNGLPLGPKAVKVFVDLVHKPETFIWRPTVDVTYIGDCLHSFVSWPATKVLFENPTDGNETHTKGSKSPTAPHVTEGANSVAPPKSRSATQSGTPSSKSPKEKSPEIETLKVGAQVVKANQKCKLMDIGGKKRVVAEGKVHSTDPEQMVHFTRLGPNAARVWVHAVLVEDAAVWRVSEEIEYMKDALGSSIAWPLDKLVVY